MLLLLLQMFVAYVQNTTTHAVVRRKSVVDLTHDGSSQFLFDLIQAQTMAPSFCLLNLRFQ